MLDFLRKLLRFKRLDLEAKLRATPECTFGGVGEVEWEVWSDGTACLEVSVKHSSLPSGSALEVVCGGGTVTSLPVAGGFAKQRIDFPEAQTGPSLSPGDPAELRLDGVVLYRGVFRRD